MKTITSKTQVLQWIDRSMGVPACFFLTQLRRLRALFGEHSSTAPIHKIVVLKLAEQGSTILAHHALSLAVARVGRENVYFFAFEENRFVLDLLDLLPKENILTIQTHSGWAIMTSSLARLRQIRKAQIDACVDMEFFTRTTACIAFLTGAHRRVGFHTYFGEGPYRGDLMTHRLLYNPHLHASRTFSSLILALDTDPKSLPAFDRVAPAAEPLPSFQPTTDESAAMETLLREYGAAGAGGLILLNANASDLLPLRRWESENYVRLAQKLLVEFPETFIGFTGSAGEADRVLALVEKVASTRCFCLAGRTNLRELVTVFSLAEILVTNDSGPAHFAALTAIEVVALFGPETPALYAPLSPRSHPLWAGLICSPCVNALNNRQTKCRNNICMQRITVQEVFEKVSALYRERMRQIAQG